ncbi:hypothetical protein, partial [Streptomyces brasiliscabiei]|uniref:hypothetical protein n=1 Tax=Streptomyces brasiliscabiei TaxID=2736302 RepID=UPI003014EB94
WRQSVQVKINPGSADAVPDRKLVISKIKSEHAKFSYELLKRIENVEYSFTTWQALLESNVLPSYENVISYGFDNSEKKMDLANKINVLADQNINLHW